MPDFVFAAAYALFVWWFSTGVIILLDNLPPRTFRWSMLGGTVLLAAAFAGLGWSAGSATEGAAYVAFTCAVLVWGWQEMSFFMGYVTGPRRTGCAPGCGGWAHFRHGIEACLYHELAIVAAAAAVVALTWGAPNQVGTWTFMLLWGMRQSAKLNFFLGVPNLSEQFLPQHLAYLKSFLACRPMNLLFPLSITGGTVLLTVLAQRAAAPGLGEFEAAGLAFLITMLALAVLEHWFLVLPLPFARLWSWAIERRRPSAGLARREPQRAAGAVCATPAAR